MLGAHFYNQAVKKTIVSFGTLFNRITVKDIDPKDPTNILGQQRVPFALWTQRKVLI